MTQRIGVESFFDNAKFRKGVDEYNRKLKGANDETTKKSKQMSGSFGNLGSMIGKLGVGFSMAAVLNEVRQFATESLEEFKAFERGIKEVYTLLGEVSQQTMDEMQKDILDFSVAQGRLTDETVPALYQAISAGVPRENVFDFLAVASDAALGGVTTLETAVDGITSVVNAYGSEVMSAAEASDLMFTAVRLGKTDFTQLSKSLFNVIPVASSLNVQFGDITAALAAMTAQGVPTSVATTQLRQALVELSKEGTKASDTFQEVAGVGFREFINEGGNLQEALALMEQAAAESGVGINDLFSSVEAGSAALALTGKGTEVFVNNLAEMADATGATAQAADTMSDSLDQAEKRTAAATEKLKILVGEGLKPSKQAWLELKGAVALALVEGIEMTQETENLEDALKAAGIQTENMAIATATARNAIDDYGNMTLTAAERTERQEVAVRLLASGTYATIDALREAIDAEIEQEARLAKLDESYARVYAMAQSSADATGEFAEAQTIAGQAIIESLEPSHNYADAQYDLSNAETEVAMRAHEAAEGVRRMIADSKAAAVASEEFRLRQEALSLALSNHFNAVLTATGETKSFEMQLYEAAAASGVGATELALLAGATGEFTAEEIDAAFQAAVMRQNIDLLVEAMMSGRISADEATDALEQLKSGEIATAEEAIALAVSLQDPTTALYAMTAEARLAREALLSIPSEVHTQIITEQVGGLTPAQSQALVAQPFASGGYTGNMGASQVAGVVHGREFVFSAPAVQNLGVDFLNAMHVAASRAGGLQSAALRSSVMPTQAPVIHVDGGEVQNNYNLSMHTSQNAPSLRRAFRLMEKLA